jgi:hypothetical protein
MKVPLQRPGLVRRLESDEEVWAAYRRRRRVRAAARHLARLLGQSIGTLRASAAFDWLAAQRECGQVTEVHGHWSDEQR